MMSLLAFQTLLIVYKSTRCIYSKTIPNMEQFSKPITRFSILNGYSRKERELSMVQGQLQKAEFNRG